MWFSAADLCIYKRAIRTNNDVEGCHNRLNTRNHHSNISFYYIFVSFYSIISNTFQAVSLISKGNFNQKDIWEIMFS